MEEIVRIIPIIGELVEEYEGKLLMVKINTDENKGIVAHYKIQNI